MAKSYHSMKREPPFNCPPNIITTRIIERTINMCRKYFSLEIKLSKNIFSIARLNFRKPEMTGKILDFFVQRTQALQSCSTDKIMIKIEQFIADKREKNFAKKV
jgi:hypothetical protein